MQYNYTLENALLDVCQGCCANPYSTVASCQKELEFVCPYYEEIQELEELSLEFNKKVSKLARCTHF